MANCFSLRKRHKITKLEVVYSMKRAIEKTIDKIFKVISQNKNHFNILSLKKLRETENKNIGDIYISG